MRIKDRSRKLEAKKSRMRKSGKLNAYKTGDSNNSHLRYKKTEVGEYLEKNQTEMKDWYEEKRNDTD